MQEKWREAFKRKLDTKAWEEADFGYAHLEPVFCDDDVDIDTISRLSVIEEIVWHWAGRLTCDGWVGYYEISNRKKKAFRRVANTFLKNHAKPEDIEDLPKYVRKHLTVKDGIVKI